MRLTLAWLWVCLAIYCSGGFANNGQGNVVLSLPPSLIAATEVVALRQLQQQQQQREQQLQQMLHEQARWKKDARVLFDGGIDPSPDMVHSKEPASAAGKHISPYNHDVEVEQQPQPQPQPQPTDFNRKALSEAYDLEARQQSAPQEIATQHGPGHGHGFGLKHATPTLQNFWARRCLAANNCPREYNRALVAAR